MLLLKFTPTPDHISPYVILEGQEKYKAILDSGADISLISYDIFKKEKLKMNEKSILIKQAIGNFKTMGSVIIKIKDKKIIHTLSFHVVENLQSEIIIGIDNLKKTKMGPILNKNIKILSVSEEKYSDESFNVSSLDIGDDITKNKIKYVEKLCEKYKHIFSTDGNVDTLNFEHSIELFENHKPIKCIKYRNSKETEKIIQSKVSEFLEKGLIEESQSSFVSPVVLIKKKMVK
ncbi:hypothetical protein DMUE_4718 [Dictyocoela muelleri]|nr:hypothetical protein DMUE_4718 [Dictyocoela muelleri]